MQLRATHAVLILCLINTINFIYCVIIPSAPTQFQTFVQHALAVNSTNVYMGLVESANFTSYAIALVVFGFLSKSQRPFHLVSLGICLWVLAAALCGLARPASSFAMIVVGRAVSGIAEGSYSAISPPLIETHAPESTRNVWLGVYYACMSLGTGVGYFYGSFMARAYGWDMSFLVAGVVMAPLLFITTCCIPPQLNAPLCVSTNSSEARCRRATSSTAKHETPTDDVVSILQSPMFLSSTLGMAALTFFVEGVAVFGPSILLGRHTFPADYVATIFGAAVVVGGIVGGTLGGYVMDVACVGHENNAAFRLAMACRQRFVFVGLSLPLAVGAVAAIDHPPTFLLLFVLAVVCVYATMGTTTTTILLTVSPARRGLATGIHTALTQLLGSVPAPLVIGLVKDALAPGCGASDEGTHARLDDCDTPANQRGLQTTMLLLMLWLLWPLVFWTFSLWWQTRHPLHEPTIDTDAKKRHDDNNPTTQTTTTTIATVVQPDDSRGAAASV
ncbi:Aste57867_20939 [Aphanomyces stellatus]|uniref:Aste57867_20939 protein n=1 Tax=Aphanomyces stellatus TaxID=120398 RepID=A0A485LGD7_9STRA|nr:hypothetical protein As57867_020871 [Aphanomyces stellatus]VFT97616.1 Aste57867_20939 [Aphanomyces stellatus]